MIVGATMLLDVLDDLVGPLEVAGAATSVELATVSVRSRIKATFLPRPTEVPQAKRRGASPMGVSGAHK